MEDIVGNIQQNPSVQSAASPAAAPVVEAGDGWLKCALQITSLGISILIFFVSPVSIAFFAFQNLTYLLTVIISGMDLSDFWSQSESPDANRKLLLYGAIAKITSVIWGILGLASLAFNLTMLAPVMLAVVLVSLTFEVMGLLEKQGVFQRIPAAAP
jgi:hypothetical protein